MKNTPPEDKLLDRIKAHIKDWLDAKVIGKITFEINTGDNGGVSDFVIKTERRIKNK